MTAHALPWFEDDDPRELRRWSVAAAVVIAIHAALISAYMIWHRAEEQLGDELPIVSVELTAPQINQQEQAPVEAPTPPKATSSDAVLPEEKPPEKVEQNTPATRTTVEEQASAPRIDASWTSRLLKHLQQFKSYPRAARDRNEQGTVKVAFTVDRAGHVLSRRVVQSSGFPALDAEAIAWIDRAQPMPAFPASMTQSEVDDLTVPLHFTLR